MKVVFDTLYSVSGSSSRNKRTATNITSLASFVATFAFGFLAAKLTTLSPAPSSFSTTTMSGRSLLLLDNPAEGSAAAAINDNDNSNGWKQIHIFYGTRDHLKDVTSLPEHISWNNQFFARIKQDEVVSKLFRHQRGLYFVDLAANDAVFTSNTYALETHYDWDGICIEPNARFWPSLSYRKCHVVGGVAGGNREPVDFFFGIGPKSLMSGIVGDNYDNNRSSTRKGWTEPRLTVTLDEILRRFRAPPTVDYLSLDVEGAESLVLTQSVLSQYVFKVMTLERPKDDLVQLLTNNQYTMLAKWSSKLGETLWAHNSAHHELDMSALNLVEKTERRPPAEAFLVQKS